MRLAAARNLASSWLSEQGYRLVPSSRPEVGSVAELLHQLVDLVVHVAHADLDVLRGVVGGPALCSHHVENLVRGEEDVSQTIEDALAQRKLDGRDRVEIEFLQ